MKNCMLYLSLSLASTPAGSAMMACFHLLFSPQGSPLLGLSSMAATCHAGVRGCTRQQGRSSAAARARQ
jgi:hypothetical protein